MQRNSTVLLAGVGGQGTILAADLLAHAASASGYDVKVSEIHGMAQRGGAVSTVVVFGEKVDSMVASLGTADYLVSFETTEALRNLPFLKFGGSLFVNNESIKPLPVLNGKASMPANPESSLAEYDAVLIPASDLASRAGTSKAMNVVLLGALSTVLPFSEEVWMRVIIDRVPARFAEMNITAFKSGREFANRH